MMKHIKYPTAHMLKKSIDPAEYYRQVIGGQIGKPLKM